MDEDIDTCMCTMLLLPFKTIATYTHTHSHVHTYISTGDFLECMIYVGLASAGPYYMYDNLAERKQI